jgi:hypothetical protein
MATKTLTRPRVQELESMADTGALLSGDIINVRLKEDKRFPSDHVKNKKALESYEGPVVFLEKDSPWSNMSLLRRLKDEYGTIVMNQFESWKGFLIEGGYLVETDDSNRGAMLIQTSAVMGKFFQKNYEIYNKILDKFGL